MSPQQPYADRRRVTPHWLHEVPTQWELISLGYLASVRTGSRDTVEAEPDGTYPFFVRSPHALKIDDFEFDTEAVITAGDGDVGNVFHHVQGKFSAHQRVYVIDGFHRVTPRFFYYYFSSEFKRAVSYGGAATTVASLRRPMFTSFPVCVPPTDEQVRIGEFLDYETGEIDAFIADQERLIDLLAERRESVIGLAFDSLQGRLMRLKDIGAHKRSGVSVNGSATGPAMDGDLGVLRTGAASKGYFDPTENKLVDDPNEIERLSTPVIADALLVNRANTPDLVGRAVYVDRAYPNLYLSDLLWLVTIKHASARYLGWWAQTRRFRDQLSLIRVGASATMQKVRYSDFARLTVPVPTSEEQRRICNELSQAVATTDAAIADARRAIALSRERRAALISAAVTGKIDVRDWKRPEHKAS